MSSQGQEASQSDRDIKLIKVSGSRVPICDHLLIVTMCWLAVYVTSAVSPAVLMSCVLGYGMSALSRHLIRVPAPRTRGRACFTAKDARKMRLIRETAIQGDFAQRSVSFQHQFLGMLYAAIDDMVVG